MSYVHHEQGYANLSNVQRKVIDVLLPHFTRTVQSVNWQKDSGPFTVVDYGAADGLNSIPLIKACLDGLSSDVQHLTWIFNDLPTSDTRIPLSKLQDEVDEHVRAVDNRTVTLQFVGHNFYDKVVPDQSVDLALSISSIQWLSQRPPEKCNPDPHNPDEGARYIAAKDLRNFLSLRSQELKPGGRLFILNYATDVKPEKNEGGLCSNNERRLVLAGRPVIRDMFDQGVITKEEYEFVQVFPVVTRTEAELKAAFTESKDGVYQSLRLLGVTTHSVPNSFYQQWVTSGGAGNVSATSEYVGQLVNALKSFFNSFWSILYTTRSKEDRQRILDTFYRGVEGLLLADPTKYHPLPTVMVLEAVKV